MKVKIKINPEARTAYIPKDLIEQGLSGDIDGYADAVTLTLVNPETSFEDIERSLLMVLDDIRFRKDIKQRVSKESSGVETSSP